MTKKITLFFLRIGGTICFIMLYRGVSSYLKSYFHLEDSVFTLLFSIAISFILLMVWEMWLKEENNKE